MLKDHADQFYFEHNCNCAEAVLRGADECYGMNLGAEEHKLLSAFGGGMGCGKACGAVCGALAVIGKRNVKTVAHEEEGFKELCAGFVAKAEEKLGSIECSDLVPRFKTEERRCAATVELVSDLLEEYLKEQGK
ncbi:MAG: C-GCAxxG-C-C family protein [Clostridia bacterium]|nr:C-GCAxxG-C-C family protein [Clostridia bacterium]